MGGGYLYLLVVKGRDGEWLCISAWLCKVGMGSSYLYLLGFEP